MENGVMLAVQINEVGIRFQIYTMSNKFPSNSVENPTGQNIDTSLELQT